MQGRCAFWLWWYPSTSFFRTHTFAFNFDIAAQLFWYFLWKVGAHFGYDGTPPPHFLDHIISQHLFGIFWDEVGAHFWLWWYPSTSFLPTCFYSPVTPFLHLNFFFFWYFLGQSRCAFWPWWYPSTSFFGIQNITPDFGIFWGEVGAHFGYDGTPPPHFFFLEHAFICLMWWYPSTSFVLTLFTAQKTQKIVHDFGKVGAHFGYDGTPPPHFCGNTHILFARHALFEHWDEGWKLYW